MPYSVVSKDWDMRSMCVLYKLLLRNDDMCLICSAFSAAPYPQRLIRSASSAAPYPQRLIRR